ncbi:Protein white [Eumeta japonica]|uniref:Protein white n=1 Tax=Eumeta variegata TaxID=151549 RepID=A0A4C1UI48_EUMVA|nr:Protein white [Eumeta japonica]
MDYKAYSLRSSNIQVQYDPINCYPTGYLISCASSSVSMAASVGPPIIIPFMLFGGFFLNSGSVPPYLGWISYLSWFRYGNEALLINQWSGVERIACTRNNSTCPASGQVVLDTLSFSQDDFTMDVVNMVLLFVGFRLLAFFALLLRTRRAK